IHMIDAEIEHASRDFLADNALPAALEAELQDKMLRAIDTIRFGDEGYVFVLGFDGVIRASAQTVDPTGEVVSLILSTIDDHPDGAYVEYSWRKRSSPDIAPKMSYIQAVAEWDWVIGAGFYLDDLAATMADRSAIMARHFWFSVLQSSLVLIAVIVVTLLIGRAIGRRIGATIDTFINDIGVAIVTNETIDQSTQRFIEMRSVARSLNGVLREKAAAGRVLSESLTEKEILLREVHHRTKNNLQIVSSILHLQSGSFDDERFRAALSECINRIHSMALVHEHLYQTERLSRIDMSDYLNSLIQNIRAGHEGPTRGRIAYSVDVERGVEFGVDLAIPFGLIVTEIVSNSIKHAFPDERTGTVALSLHRAGNSYVLEVTDDGVGVPLGIDRDRPDSLGMTLLRALTDQISANVTVTTEPGVRWRLEIPIAAATQSTTR
ncbi:MAG: hypothetical protein EA382_06650, partial [Spirochaetaceae bacterium]